MSTPPAIRLARATPADFPQVAELFEALHTFNASLEPDFALGDDWRSYLAERLARAQEEQDDSVWVLAWDGEEAVGLLIGETHYEPPVFRRRRWLELSALYVRPSHRRHGVARLLVDYLMEWARAHGFPSVQLYVTASNTGARAFYAREGFTVLQEIWRKPVPPAG